MPVRPPAAVRVAPTAHTASAVRFARGAPAWHRTVGVCALLGLASTAALPPFYLVPALLFAFGALFWILCNTRRAAHGFLFAWAFGCGHFAGGLHWLAVAFTHDAPLLRLAAVPAVLSAAAVLAVFWGCVGALACKLKHDTARAFALPALFALAELARAHLAGFPWNPLGSVWSFSALTLQPVAWIGINALGTLTLVAACGLALAARNAPRTRLAVVACLLPLPVLFSLGALRLVAAPEPDGDRNPQVRLRLVQPNFTIAEKDDPALDLQNLESQLRASREGKPIFTHLIWPESTVAFSVGESEELRAELAAVLPADGTLVLGNVSVARGAEGKVKVYNSIYALDARAQTLWRYDKHKLVPFGEYIPFRGVLERLPLGALNNFTQGALDFSRGAGPQTLPLTRHTTVSPLICYEVIFAGRVVAAERPDWILNLTNDAWFGNTTGPRQHFAAARARAVEEGLPVVRAANSGISGVIDAYGRIRATLPLRVSGTLDAPLPNPAPRTLFARLGLASDPFLVLLLFVAAALARRAEQRQARTKVRSPN